MSDMRQGLKEFYFAGYMPGANFNLLQLQPGLQQQSNFCTSLTAELQHDGAFAQPATY